jgi:hypothetical protein
MPGCEGKEKGFVVRSFAEAPPLKVCAEGKLFAAAAPGSDWIADKFAQATESACKDALSLHYE